MNPLDQSLDDLIKSDKVSKSNPKNKKSEGAAGKLKKAREAKRAKVGLGSKKAPVGKANPAAGKPRLSRSLKRRLGTVPLTTALATPKPIFGSGANSGRISKARKTGLQSSSAATRSRASQRFRERESPGAWTTKSKPSSSRNRKSTTANHRSHRENNETISIKGEAGPAPIFVANLDPGASTEDVKIESCTLLYDSSGNSTGNAEVVYKLRSSALEAIKKLNNVVADGRILIVQPKGNFGNIKPVQSGSNSSSSKSQSSSRQKPHRSSIRRQDGDRMDID
ncbi:hypothetical protein BB560_006160 [Smittium megazygosporum]|uniref:RRM domain-containing protein n=1 Tax=Smittium megazygosporum TaxID=133381 RepID=A0A2T9YF97_9FUNG|nr:hypothetical protein BB560_006160 [Smittium megazygosporum]